VQGLRLRGQVRRLPIALGLLLAAVALAVAVATTPDHRSQRLLQANAAMQSQLLRQAVVVEGRAPGDLAGFQAITHAFDDALSDGISATRPRSTERDLLRAQSGLADRWRLAATQALLAQGDRSPSGPVSWTGSRRRTRRCSGA
jgi:hypothetical protein